MLLLWLATWASFCCCPPLMSFLLTLSPSMSARSKLLKGSTFQATLLERYLRSSFVTPVLEETLFRGVIFAGLARNHRLSTALIASSLIFALFHHNPAQFIGPLLSGLLFAAAYQRSCSLLPCFLGHGLNNFVWFLSSFYHSISHSERALFHLDPSLDVPRIIVGAIVLALCVAVLLRSKRNKDKGSGGNSRVGLEASAI